MKHLKMTWALVTPVRNIYANFIEDAKAAYQKNSTNGTDFVVDSVWWFRRRIGSAITTDFALGISRRSPSGEFALRSRRCFPSH